MLSILALIGAVQPALAQLTPQDAVAGHFSAIEAESYTEADGYFSRAFRSAFKGEVQTLNHYYTVRRQQIERGYEVMDSRELLDEDHTTAMVVVDFNPLPEAPIAVTERLYYYLILEHQGGNQPGTDSAGFAWRIDIFDSFEFETLAEARRRPYLYTNESWPDQQSKELRSRQGLFRIQWALESYFYDNLEYPDRLLGGEDDRDSLVRGGYLTGTYPASGFNDRPMEAVGADERSSGDFSYIGFDVGGTGETSGYWLLLHGKVPGNYYFENTDIVYILSNSEIRGQHALAEAFSEFWLARTGSPPLRLTGATQPLEPSAGMLPSLNPGGGEVELENGGLSEHQITPEPVFREAAADWREADNLAGRLAELSTLANRFWWHVTVTAPAILPGEEQASSEPETVPVIRPLVVYTFGF